VISSLKVLVNSIKKRGIINTFKFVFYEYLFDYVYKVDTNGYIELDDLQTITDTKDATKYQGSNYFILSKFFKKYKNSILNSTVVDFGSGKGRILIMAMKYNAKKCIGIEFAKELIDISKINLSKYKNNNNITTKDELILDSALNYKFSGDEDILFFYNPFNETILNPILNNILNSQNDPMVVYINPVHPPVSGYMSAQ
jgi:16S rRNA G966 N2-methylase RsmD